jgi:hypothetical protein
MSSTDPNLGLTYNWAIGENVKTGMDANLQKLGAVVQLSVLSKTTDVPASPSNGDRYIVPAAATGAWSGQDGKIAVYIEGAWTFYQPAEGWRAWVVDITEEDVYTSGAWETLKVLV